MDWMRWDEWDVWRCGPSPTSREWLAITAKSRIRKRQQSFISQTRIQDAQKVILLQKLSRRASIYIKIHCIGIQLMAAGKRFRA